MLLIFFLYLASQYSVCYHVYWLRASYKVQILARTGERATTSESAGNHGHSEKNAENQELTTRVGELQIGGERGKVGIHLQAQRNKETGEKREKKH